MSFRRCVSVLISIRMAKIVRRGERWCQLGGRERVRHYPMTRRRMEHCKSPRRKNDGNPKKPKPTHAKRSNADQVANLFKVLMGRVFKAEPNATLLPYKDEEVQRNNLCNNLWIYIFRLKWVKKHSIKSAYN